ncbi:hypothetical protein QE152_g40292 [Popillia japonica]|uniref:Uncharacterized protein n=1 Tax=Popillia japonica TaxID=7064 RepID=A0AAW1HRX8_POPJA
MINERSSQKAVGQQANLLPPKTKANKSQKYKLALFRATPADHQPEHWRKSPKIKTMEYHNYANQKTPFPANTICAFIPATFNIAKKMTMYRR